MMTSGEKRGLIVLTIVLAFIIVFVICRRALFSPDAGSAIESTYSSDSITAVPGCIGNGGLDSVSLDSVCVKRDKEGRAVRKSGKSSGSKSKSGRVPVVRDPLSQPVNK